MSFIENDLKRHEPHIGQEINWTPALTLKPHHALNYLSVTKAISGETSKIHGIIFYLRFLVGQRLNFSGYSRDIVGTKLDGIKEFLRQENEFLERLRELKDDNIIQLDLSKDDLCRSCVVGRHCMAKVDEAVEQARVLELSGILKKSGFEEGKDFIFRKTKHILYDFQGKNYKSTTNPQPVGVTFESMLVKMGVLRAVIKHKWF